MLDINSKIAEQDELLDSVQIEVKKLKNFSIIINDELTEEMFQDVINSIKLFQLDSENIKMDHDESIKENKETKAIIVFFIK